MTNSFSFYSAFLTIRVGLFATVVAASAILPRVSNGQDQPPTENTRPDTQASDGLAQSIARTTHALNRNQKYLLRYKMTPGDTLTYQVEDTFTQKTSMSGVSDNVSSRTQNIKRYDINNIDSIGSFLFDQTLVRTQSWTRLNDEMPVQYDSDSAQEVPDDYRKIARMVGVPQLSFQMRPDGEMVTRKSHFSDWDLKTGGAFIRFPEAAIPTGFRWYVPEVVHAKTASGRKQPIRLRKVYELVRVADGQARISCRTETLTPTTAKLKSQILQHLTHGYRVFDINRGCFVRTEMHWNESVNGFQNSDSQIIYLRCYTESLIENSDTANTASVRQASSAKPVSTHSSNSPRVRTRFDAPVFRR